MHAVTERQARKDIVEIGKRIHAHGWISSTDGNISVRLGKNRLLTTPTGIHKGYMKESDLVVTDMNGKLLTGTRKPSSELMMHLTCYNRREGIGAVIHAHPTLCIAFSLARITLAKCLLPEVVFTLGSIPTAQYSTPTTEEVPRSIEELIGDYDAVILERHGSLTVGTTLFDAYNTLERMEHVAEITHKARQLGEVHPLSAEQMDKLLNVSKKLGLPERKFEHNCEGCNACPEGGNMPSSSHTPKPSLAEASGCAGSDCENSCSSIPAAGASRSAPADSALIEAITREVIRELQKNS